MDIGEEQFARWCQWGADHPIEWMEDAFDVKVPLCQKRVVEGIATHDMVAVATGQAVGKTFVSYLVSMWYALCRQGLVVVAAPTWVLLQKQWWPGFKGLVMDRMGLPEEALEGGNWMLAGMPMRGILPINAKNPRIVRGFHASNILLIEDEASEVPDELYEQFLGSQISRGEGGEAKMLLMSNPTRSTGHFAAACRNKDWYVIKMSSMDSPNITGEMVISGLADMSGIEMLRKEWGENSPAYKSRVLGEFTEEAEYDRYIPERLLMQAMDEKPVVGGAGVSVQGVDVAMYGNDVTASVIMQDGVVKDIAMLPGGTDVGEVAQWVCDRHLSNECVLTAYDATAGGWGLGVLSRRINAYGVHFARSNKEKARWANLRTEYYARLLDELRGGRVKLPPGLANLDRLLEELRSVCYKVQADGKVMLEPKEVGKKRLGRSTDCADALVLAVDAGKYVVKETPEERHRRGFAQMMERYGGGDRKTGWF